jgi:glycosyltransferase involved in cell wall biosynthesis
MDRNVPPRIAYWTSAFEPEMEAISAEVALLRRRFPSSVAWGLSHRHWLRLSWRRGFCFNHRLQLVFRALTRVLEPAFQLNHVFGSLGDWFYLEGLRRRPTLLTVAANRRPVQKSLLDRIDRFVVEYPAAKIELKQLGIEEKQIQLIFPPVDLWRFAPKGAPTGSPFTVVFASSPDLASWLEARGVPQILDAAALRPRMQFRLLWRPWGDSLPQVQQWIAQRALQNVDLVVGRFPDMACQYQAAHATLAPFVDMERCKAAPNSLVESLACGRPVITTPHVGLAELIEENRAGIVCDASGADLAESLDRLQSEWPHYSARARHLAERWFSTEDFVESYERLYDQLTATPRAWPPASPRRIQRQTYSSCNHCA